MSAFTIPSAREGKRIYLYFALGIFPWDLKVFWGGWSRLLIASRLPVTIRLGKFGPAAARLLLISEFKGDFSHLSPPFPHPPAALIPLGAVFLGKTRGKAAACRFPTTAARSVQPFLGFFPAPVTAGSTVSAPRAPCWVSEAGFEALWRRPLSPPRTLTPGPVANFSASRRISPGASAGLGFSPFQGFFSLK